MSTCSGCDRMSASSCGCCAAGAKTSMFFGYHHAFVAHLGNSAFTSKTFARA
eukprot:CAMPEP_0183363208 /NCGR_PEP_ID=MMETSP0164_2-20130417/73913_1 /TAXON_ID=221442 /ORGANISM="Coccolithus pelagicus ssp braarudi, Strain PLY182g" /LENGTH=51 /DNA_ID=CAMNT_0025538253 /DNA_START=125 /DNA_END=276 /DNA_ORIENTATION=-